MTTTQDAALTPQPAKWTDEELKVIAFWIATQYLMDKSAGKATPMTQLIQAKMIEMRDEYEAERQQLRAQIAAQNSELIEAQQYILELERAVSGDWQPVTPGFEIECAGKSGWKLYASEGDIGVVSRDRTKEYYVYAEPHGLRLCKWQPTPMEAQP